MPCSGSAEASPTASRLTVGADTRRDLLLSRLPAGAGLSRDRAFVGAGLSRDQPFVGAGLSRDQPFVGAGLSRDRVTRKSQSRSKSAPTKDEPGRCGKAVAE